MSKELDELRAKAKAIEQRQRERQMDGYHYARSLGFTGTESLLLSRKSKSNILKLSKELKS